MALRKSLYGLKQSPRARFQPFSNVLKGNGYIQGQSNHALFAKHSEEGKLTVIIIYVDDNVLTKNHAEEMMTHVKALLSNEFEMKELGSFKNKIGMLGWCKPADTPMDANVKLGARDGCLQLTKECTKDWLVS